MNIKYLFALTLFLVSPITAHAQTATPAAKKALPDKPAINLPLIQTASNITINQPVDRDLIVAGGQVTVDAPIVGDVYAAGGQLSLKGTVEGNLIVAGGNITVSGSIKKNLIVAGGQVVLDSSATIGGYLLAGAGEITLAGKIAGPAQIGAGNLTVTDTAVIGGDLQAAVNQSTISPQSQIVGESKITIVEKSISPAPESRRLRSSFFVAGLTTWHLLSLLGNIIVLLVLVRLFQPILPRLISPILTSPLSMLGWGLIKLIVCPFVILLLLITIIGIPLAGLTTVAYITAIYLTQFVVAITLGSYFRSRQWLKTNNIYFQAIVGLLVITALTLVPFIGLPFKLVILLFGLGAILTWEKSLLHS